MENEKYEQYTKHEFPEAVNGHTSFRRDDHLRHLHKLGQTDADSEGGFEVQGDASRHVAVVDLEGVAHHLGNGDTGSIVCGVVWLVCGCTLTGLLHAGESVIYMCVCSPSHMLIYV